MQAPIEQFVLLKLVHPIDVLGDAEYHLAKKKRIALARGETVPQHVPQTFDPAPQRLALIEFGSDDAVLDNHLHHVPDVVHVLDWWQLPPAQFRIDITEEFLEWAAEVSSEDTHPDLPSAQPAQEEFGGAAQSSLSTPPTLKQK